MAALITRKGPVKAFWASGSELFPSWLKWWKHVWLAVVELEEEKANLFQLLLMLGLTMLFAAFGLMSLMVLIIWAVDPQYRLNAMIATTVVLLLLALIGGIWTLRKSRKSTLLRHTRHELANDRQLLEEESREQ